jgi:hypothetical protein
MDGPDIKVVKLSYESLSLRNFDEMLQALDTETNIDHFY